MSIREIKKVVAGRRTQDGAGVSLVRVFGYRETADFDPFLMFDAFDSNDPADYIKGFPWHPHRGIETVTYLIQGDIEHGDSLGNKGSILDGDCQWMTAGSGIIHQEMPQIADRMLGGQLWINLPAKDKMTPPAYGDIKSKDIPLIEEKGAKIKVVAGKYKDSEGAFHGKFVDANYFDVEMAAGAEWAYESNPDNTLFIYIFQGDGQFGSGEPGLEKQALLFDQGVTFKAKAGSEGLRFVLLEGKPLREPIAWGGPIVMNTEEELSRAFMELDSGDFIKGA